MVTAGRPAAAHLVRPTGSTELTAASLLASLSYAERRYDSAGLEQHLPMPVDATDISALPAPGGRVAR